jgi:hypothetical protein
MMTLSIVEFEVFKDLPDDDEEAPTPFSKDGVSLYVAGVVGGMSTEYGNEGYDLFRGLLEDVDVKKFWSDGGNAISQRVYCVFDVRWVSSYDGYYGVEEWDCEIDYLGIADTSKWTAQSLAVQAQG